MAIVVGSPIPADQLGPLEPLIKAVLFALQTHSGCAQFFKKSCAEMYALQWQLRCSSCMIIVSEDGSILLGMECC